MTNKLLLLVALALAGCASIPEGVEMDENEAAACKAVGCTVWTVDELKEALRKAFEAGYRQGVRSI